MMMYSTSFLPKNAKKDFIMRCKQIIEILAESFIETKSLITVLMIERKRLIKKLFSDILVIDSRLEPKA